MRREEKRNSIVIVSSSKVVVSKVVCKVVNNLPYFTQQFSIEASL